MARTPTNHRPSVAEEVAALRAQRLVILDQREALASAPVSNSEAEQRVDQTLDRLARDAAEWISFSTLTSAEGGPLDLGSAQRHAPVGVIVLLGGREAVKSVLMHEAKTLIGSRGVDRAVRDGKRASLERELRTIEIAEEMALRSADDEGLSIPRRPDADMSIVLAEKLA